MGSTGSLADDTTKEVVLSIHGVHNVQRSPNESHYGMATDHTSNTEVPVTSARPARVTAGLHSVLSVRIYLHERGAPSSADRAVGQVSIPVQEVCDLCGGGIYQTWFFLEPPSDYGTLQPNQLGWRSQLSDKFKRALAGVSQQLHAPRICLTLLEATVDPDEWALSREARLAFFDTLLISHAEHLLIAHAYFEAARASASENRRRNAENSQSELVEIEELETELDLITEEANRRIEKGNESILDLKAQLQKTRDVELAQVWREHREAERRLSEMQAKNAEIVEMLAGVNDERHEGGAAAGEELEKLRKEVVVLTDQKAALGKMVPKDRGSVQEDGAAGSFRSLVRGAAVRALADIRAGGKPTDAGGDNGLLPDATEPLPRVRGVPHVHVQAAQRAMS